MSSAEWMILLAVLIPAPLWLFALVRIARRERGIVRLIWLVVVLFTNWLGAVSYLSYRKLEEDAADHSEKRP